MAPASSAPPPSNRANDGRGRFIVFEGLDGAGTTTQLQRLADWLRHHGVDVETTREPSNGPLGASLRQVIEGRVELDSVALALAFAADRADHLFNSYNGVFKSLENGRSVLCDRYLFSTLAYQSDDRVTEEWLRRINQFALQPDITIFIDADPDVCIDRITSRSAHAELFHDTDVLRRTMQNYRRIVADGTLVGRLLVVNGNGKPDDVFDELMEKFTPWWDTV